MDNTHDVKPIAKSTEYIGIRYALSGSIDVGTHYAQFNITRSLFGL